MNLDLSSFSSWPEWLVCALVIAAVILGGKFHIGTAADINRIQPITNYSHDPPLASYWLSRSPVKRIIQQARHNRVVDQLFQKLSGAGRTFQTMAEARESIRRHRPETLGHLDEKLIVANFSFYSNIQMSDYPVLLWLLTILRTSEWLPHRIATSFWPPVRFIINRSPMQSQGKSFFSVQEGEDWAVPCQVRSLEQVKAEMQAEGYTLVESWVDPVKSLIPLATAYARDLRCGFGFGRRGLALVTIEMAARSCSAAMAPRKSVVLTCSGL